MQQAYKIDPQKPEIQYFWGLTYSALQNHETAITFLQYALQNDIQQVDVVREALVREALLLNNTELALQELHTLMLESDTTLYVYAQFIRTSIQAGLIEEAYMAAKQVVEHYPREAEAYVLLAEAAIESNILAEAKEAVQQATSLDPTIAVPVVRKGE